MFYIEEIELAFDKSASTFAIPTQAREICEDIMDRIYKTDPTYWPYGLDISGHTKAAGNVYLVRERTSDTPVGFVGWQQFNEGMKKVGYYSIGILPQFRKNGFARAAVQQLLRVKSATVDQVKAFIERHNTPSIGLARRLGVPIVHDL